MGTLMLLNKQRALGFMLQHQLDAIVATSPLNVTYLSDYYCWIDSQLKDYMRTPGGSGHLIPSYAVLPRNESPALVLHSIFALNAADIGVKDLYLFGDPIIDNTFEPKAMSESHRRIFEHLRSSQRQASPVDALFSILKDRGLTRSRIGLEMEALPPGMKEHILQAFPHAEFRDCSDLLRLIRMVKSTEEIMRLKRSAEIAEAAAAEALAIAGPGVHTSEIAQHYRVSVAKQGADFDHFVFCYCGLGVASEPDYQLASHDVMYVDFGCSYRRYASDTGTTLALSEPPDAVLKKHEALRECIQAGVDAMRPGVNASAVQAAMAQVIADHKINASFPHGHGLGLEACEYPLIVPDNGKRIRDGCVDLAADLPLEPNMVINLESRSFILGVDSIHTESSFLVTATGSEPLARQDRSTPVWPRHAQAARRS